MLRQFVQDLVQLRVDLVVATALFVEDVARRLGNERESACAKAFGQRLNFTEILQHLRRDLAIRYLDDRKLHVSKIAWLLGFTR